MTRLVKAELMKWRTTRSLYASIAGVVLIVALGVSAAIATAGQAGNAGLDTTEGVRTVFAAAGNGGFLVMIMGIISTAGEYRQNTITAALLITPRRRRFVAAKTIAMAIIGVGMAVVACAVTLAIALPWLATKNVHPALLSSDVALVLVGASAVISLFGLIGVGVGAILRNQVAAVLGSLTWLLEHRVAPGWTVSCGWQVVVLRSIRFIDRIGGRGWRPASRRSRCAAADRVRTRCRVIADLSTSGGRPSRFDGQVSEGLPTMTALPPHL